jgi:hypothetical protein
MGLEHRPFLAHLRGSDFDSIVADRDAVQAMLDHPGWGLVEDLLERTHAEATTRLLFTHAGADGSVLGQAEYARLLGFLSGLKQTRWAAEAFIEHAERVRKKEG